MAEDIQTQIRATENALAVHGVMPVDVTVAESWEWTLEHMRRAHAAYGRGERTVWAIEGNRAYNRAANRRRPERQGGKVRRLRTAPHHQPLDAVSA